jgi:thiol-disulfide isomerase/thioredoxin
MKTIYYFTADWCSPCKRTRPIVEEINRENPNVSVQFIDADMEIDLVSKFNIRSIPTFILFENEKEISRMSGGKTKQELESFINGK